VTPVSALALTPSDRGWSDADAALAKSIDSKIAEGKALARKRAALPVEQRVFPEDYLAFNSRYSKGWRQAMVELRTIGESGNTRWIPYLCRYWREFRGDGDPSPDLIFNTISDLRTETVGAYLKIGKRPSYDAWLRLIGWGMLRGSGGLVALRQLRAWVAASFGAAAHRYGFEGGRGFGPARQRGSPAG